MNLTERPLPTINVPMLSLFPSAISCFDSIGARIKISEMVEYNTMEVSRCVRPVWFILII